MKLALQISPEAKSAYFNDYLAVAEQELVFLLGERKFQLEEFGGLQFFYLDAQQDELPTLARLSFVLGMFEVLPEGLKPLSVSPNWPLHDDFLFGSKFKGKTNERLTQLLINVGLRAINKQPEDSVKLLDPMAGRATTLLWAMQYGLKAWGVEQDVRALDEVRQIVKKWCKVHRQKHQLKEGFIGKANRANKGKFIEFSAEEATMRLIQGDAREVGSLLKEKFDLIISDLPYGVQHHTTEKTRNPLDVVQASLPGWSERLKKDGAIVLAYNKYQPKRDALLQVFEEQGFAPQAINVTHRMSESIVRDIIVVKRS